MPLRRVVPSDVLPFAVQRAKLPRAMPYELLLVVPGLPERLTLTSTVRIGRAEGNNIVIDQGIVSSEHCELHPTADGWEVVDLGSTNGTFVDGERITSAPIGPSTTLRLGNTGPILQLTIPALAAKGSTKQVQPDDFVDRIFATMAPQNMSPHTEMMRVAVQERRVQESSTWKHRIQRYRVALGVLAVVALGAGVTAVVQSRRAALVRQTAASVFGTIKEIDLDIRQVEAA
ncbi:MAG: FHA domain-containing protein, partial [Gemmatimonadaceae bacterium]